MPVWFSKSKVLQLYDRDQNESEPQNAARLESHSPSFRQIQTRNKYFSIVGWKNPHGGEKQLGAPLEGKKMELNRFILSYHFCGLYPNTLKKHCNRDHSTMAFTEVSEFHNTRGHYSHYIL